MIETNVTTVRQEASKDKQQLSRRTCLPIVIVTIGALVVGTILFGTVFLRSSEPARSFVQGLVSDPVAGPINTTEGFYNAMIRHDYARANDYLASSLEASYSAKNLKAHWEVLERNEGAVTLTDLKAYVKTGDKDNSHARVRLTTRNGSKYEISLVLSNIDSEWKIVQADPDLLP